MDTTQAPKKKMGLGKKILIALVALVIIGLIAKSGKKGGADAAPTAGDTKTAAAAPAAIGIGQTLKTDYFEVTVSKVELTNKINTGNEFSDVAADQGNRFLVMSTTFKNIDNESRMIIDGSVFITYNGKDYEYDKSETIMADGYGLFLDQINPLTSKTTKLVYKIPAEIKGPAYYKPGRASDDEKIFLGDLK